MNTKNLDRRSFVKVVAGGLAAIPVIAHAQAEPSRLAEDDPTAIALGYKEDSAEVDASKFPNHQDTQLCSGCSLYAPIDEEWGGCPIFPAKQVAADGWCSAYVAKPS